MVLINQEDFSRLLRAQLDSCKNRVAHILKKYDEQYWSFIYSLIDAGIDGHTIEAILVDLKKGEPSNAFFNDLFGKYNIGPLMY